MKHLTFCPQCGKETLKFNGLNKISCNDCDFSLYHNTAAAVAVIIKHEDKILFTRRNQQPGLGKLDLPGGFTDPNENAEETCRRELKEELGLNVVISRLKYIGSQPNIYPYNKIHYYTLDLFFEYEIENINFYQEINLNEISECIWIKKSELNIDDLAFESQKEFFRKQ